MYKASRVGKDDGVPTSLFREYSSLSELQHPNVVKLYGVEALLLLKPSCLQGSRKSNSIEGIVNRPNHHRDGTKKKRRKGKPSIDEN